MCLFWDILGPWAMANYCRAVIKSPRGTSVFWNIEWFLAYLTFYPPKKIAPPLIRVEKKFLQNWAYRILKEVEFCLISKMRRSLLFGKREKQQKNWIFRDFFLRKKSLGTSWRKSSIYFWDSAKFRFFWYPLRPILKKFFSTLIKDGAVFLKLKAQIR